MRKNMAMLNQFIFGDKNKESGNNTINQTFQVNQQTAFSNKLENEKTDVTPNSFNITNNQTTVFNERTNLVAGEEQNFKNNANGVINNRINSSQDNLNTLTKANNDIPTNADNNQNNESQEKTENCYLKNNNNGNITLETKFNFNSSLKIRQSLTEQLCEEISMKLGKIHLCKSYLETYIYEKNPYTMNFIYLKDDVSESKNRVLNSVLLSSFCNIIWSNNIYKHEYLMSKELLNKYFKAIQKNPDKNNYCIVPIYDLNKIKMILNDHEKNIKMLKKRKLIIRKNNENLLFILNIIKNNFAEIKIKAQRIIQRLLFRLDILDKLFMLKNNSSFFSTKYEFSKFKLIEILDLFNSFSIDTQLQKINQNIEEFVREKRHVQNFLYTDKEFTSNLKNTIEKNEQHITELKSTTSEICQNVDENREYLYSLSAFEREDNYEML
ncbi:conserved Plasmodium protein, unknown function [Plasmodium chabaudi adami]|uniref:Uncharacterized protein n=1 Tax=Plasmodium chabaudi adami TaxID=5826 RepID=A0A1D3LME7_PLACE|nr:conserved Plasmodium protein, unknown function [Plasmodium chabaudi adami]